METDHLILRKFAAADWQDLYEYLSDEEVIRFEPYEAFSIDRSRKEAMERAANPAFWAVCLKESEKLIGNIYFEKQDYETWEIGFVFNRSYQGKGYATEAARSVMAYGFTKANVRRIIAKCNPDNTASWHLLDRLGMRREGHLRENIWFRKDTSGQPIWQDTYEYAILAREWELSLIHI